MSLPPRRTAADVNVEPEVAKAFDGVIRRLGSKQSRVGYEKDWVAFRTWLAVKKVDVLKVEADDVEQYVADIFDEGKAKSTRGRALSVIRAVYRSFVVKRLVEVNPAREVVNIKHGGTKHTPWLEEDVLALMLGFRGEGGWIDRRDRVIVQVFAGIGWRRTETSVLRIENFKDGMVTGIVKGGKELSATVSPWLLAEVRAWCEYAGISSGPIFLRGPDDRRAASGDILYKSVVRVGRAVGLPKGAVTPHALRRTLATLAKRRGVPLGDIQQSLGHSSIVTTERYLKGSQKVEHAPGDWMAELADKNKPKDEE